MLNLNETISCEIVRVRGKKLKDMGNRNWKLNGVWNTFLTRIYVGCAKMFQRSVGWCIGAGATYKRDAFIANRNRKREKLGNILMRVEVAIISVRSFTKVLVRSARNLSLITYNFNRYWNSFNLYLFKFLMVLDKTIVVLT